MEASGVNKYARPRHLRKSDVSELGLGRVGRREKCTLQTRWVGPLGRGNTKTRRKKKRKKEKAKQYSWGLDVQKWLGKTRIEFHWPGYQFIGPGAHLEKRLKRGDPGINRLDKIAKQQVIDYSRVKNLRNKHAADRKLIKAIHKLPAGPSIMTEWIIKKVNQA